MAVERDWRGPEVIELIEKNVRSAVGRSAIIVQREVKLQLSGTSPSAAGSPPGVRTGTLRRSVQVDLSGLGDTNPSARVGPGVPYAAIHEFGRTIFPKSAGALAVPIGAEGRAASREAKGSLRSLNLTFIKRKGKPPLLVKTDGGRVKPLFVLLRSVTLPARPYLRPALSVVRQRVLDQFSPDRLLRLGMVT